MHIISLTDGGDDNGREVEDEQDTDEGEEDNRKVTSKQPRDDLLIQDEDVDDSKTHPNKSTNPSKNSHPNVRNEKKNRVQKRKRVGDAVRKDVESAVMGKNPRSADSSKPSSQKTS